MGSTACIPATRSQYDFASSSLVPRLVIPRLRSRHAFSIRLRLERHHPPRLIPRVHSRHAFTSCSRSQASPACVPATRSQYDFAWGSSSYYLYSQNNCVELPIAERSQKIGNNIVYFPSYFMEERSESRFTKLECDALKTNGTCAGHTASKCDTQSYDWGRPCFTEVGVVGTSNYKCTCWSRQNYLVAGLTKQALTLSHVYEDTNPTTNAVDMGRSAWKSADVEAWRDAGGLSHHIQKSPSFSWIFHGSCSHEVQKILEHMKRVSSAYEIQCGDLGKIFAYVFVLAYGGRLMNCRQFLGEVGVVN